MIEQRRDFKVAPFAGRANQSLDEAAPSDSAPAPQRTRATVPADDAGWPRSERARS